MNLGWPQARQMPSPLSYRCSSEVQFLHPVLNPTPQPVLSLLPPVSTISQAYQSTSLSCLKPFWILSTPNPHRTVERAQWELYGGPEASDSAPSILSAAPPTLCFSTWFLFLTPQASVYRPPHGPAGTERNPHSSPHSSLLSQPARMGKILEHPQTQLRAVSRAPAGFQNCSISSCSWPGLSLLTLALALVPRSKDVVLLEPSRARDGVQTRVDLMQDIPVKFSGLRPRD